MTDPSNTSGNSNVPVKKPDDTGMALIIYILYLVTCLGAGITGIIGVILAYVQKDKASAWIQSHYQFQIRTFWIALVGSIIGVVLAFVFIGWLLLLALLVWYIIRCVKGIVWLQAGEAVPDPTSWIFGSAKSS